MFLNKTCCYMVLLNINFYLRVLYTYFLSASFNSLKGKAVVNSQQVKI